MQSKFVKSMAVGVSAIAMTFAFSSAQADPFLPVVNLTFDQFQSPSSPPKNNFSVVNPVGWERGHIGGSGDLVFIDAPGTATSSSGGYAVYAPFSDPPPGGNFVQADGNPDYESTFQQTISGLEPHTTYLLTFWQAASQQAGFPGDTTEQWKVFFGAGGISLDAPSDANCTMAGYTNCYKVSAATLANNQEVDSTLMFTPHGQMNTGGWQLVSMEFTTGDETSDILSFLAWGNDGSNINEPPTVFLAGVNSPALNTPEPATLTLFGAGIAGVWLRRRAKRKAQA